MLNKKDLIKNIENITKDHPTFLYDVSITTPSSDTRSNKQLINPNSSMSRMNLYTVDWSGFSKNYQVMPIQKDVNYKIKSVIVISSFTHVAADYFFSNYLLNPILYHLNKHYNPSYDKNGVFFLWDDYVFDRKQYALRSGIAKLSKTSMVFHQKFGLNCKIDMIFCTEEFDEMETIEETLYYDNCIGCDAPCVTKCPMECKMDFELVDWAKCANFADTTHMANNPEEMCRICQSSCPHSEDLKQEIKKQDSRYGQYLSPKFLHLN